MKGVIKLIWIPPVSGELASRPSSKTHEIPIKSGEWFRVDFHTPIQVIGLVVDWDKPKKNSKAELQRMRRRRE